jgi:adenylate kinase
MKLIVLHGLPGVGKLTVARELAKLTGFRVFHNHLTVDLVLSVFEFGSPEFVELREKIWFEVISRAAEERIDGLIFTFAFERTVRDGFIRSLRNAVETRDGELILVNLKASTDEMEKRMGDPARKAFGKLNSVQQFRELNEAGAFSHPEIPADGISFDTTNLSPSAAALKIADAINGSGQ